MKFLWSCVCFAALVKLATPAPADGFVFPTEKRRDKKLEPIITPPVLPVLEHLERDPSTLLPGDAKPTVRHAGVPNQKPLRPRFGGINGPKFGGGFSLTPSNNGGLTASISSSASGAGASQSASQSFSFGFNEGFSASHSASQSSSFNGFGNGFSGSQASSQAASFSGNPGSAAASSASSLASGGASGSQSASSAFGFNGFNSLNGFQSTPPEDPVNFGEGLLDVRHRGGHQAGAFVFPGASGRGVGVSTSKITKPRQRGGSEDWLAILVSD